MLKNWKCRLIGAIAAVASANLWAAGLPAGYATESYAAALAGARQSGKPVLLYFTQSHCGYCENVARLLDSAELRAAFAPSYHFVAVAIDKDRRGEPFQQAMISRFRIAVAPTFVFLDGAGNYLCTAHGAFRHAAEAMALHRFVQAAKDDAGTLLPGYRHCGAA